MWQMLQAILVQLVSLMVLMDQLRLKLNILQLPLRLADLQVVQLAQALLQVRALLLAARHQPQVAQLQAVVHHPGAVLLAEADQHQVVGGHLHMADLQVAQLAQALLQAHLARADQVAVHLVEHQLRFPPHQ